MELGLSCEMRTISIFRRNIWEVWDWVYAENVKMEMENKEKRLMGLMVLSLHMTIKRLLGVGWVFNLHLNEGLSQCILQ